VTNGLGYKMCTTMKLIVTGQDLSWLDWVVSVMTCGEWFGCQSYGTLESTKMKLFLEIGNVTC